MPVSSSNFVSFHVHALSPDPTDLAEIENVKITLISSATAQLNGNFDKTVGGLSKK